MLKEAEQRHHVAASTVIFNDLLLTCSCVKGNSSATAALSLVEEMQVSSAARTSCSLLHDYLHRLLHACSAWDLLRRAGCAGGRRRGAGRRRCPHAWQLLRPVRSQL